MRVEVFFCVLFFSITGKYGLLQAVQPPVTFLFKALQMNIWMGGSKVDGAVGMIVDEIIHSDADIIFLNELRDYQGENFISYMVKELAWLYFLWEEQSFVSRSAVALSD